MIQRRFGPLVGGHLTLERSLKYVKKGTKDCQVVKIMTIFLLNCSFLIWITSGVPTTVELFQCWKNLTIPLTAVSLISQVVRELSSTISRLLMEDIRGNSKMWHFSPNI